MQTTTPITIAQEEFQRSISTQFSYYTVQLHRLERQWDKWVLDMETTCHRQVWPRGSARGSWKRQSGLFPQCSEALSLFSYCAFVFLILALCWYGTGIIYSNGKIDSPGWATQLIGASSPTPKGCRFDSWSGNIPRLWVQFLVGVRRRGKWSMLPSHIKVSLSHLSFSLFLSPSCLL